MTIDKRLNEILSFAAKEAIAALSKLLDKPTILEAVNVSIINTGIKDEIDHLYPQKGGAIIMTTTLVGMIDGVSAFILPTNSALKLCDVLLNRGAGKTSHLSELEQSVLLKVGNTFIGCFLNSLGYVSVLSNILYKKLTLTITPEKELPDLLYSSNIKDEFIVRTCFHVRDMDIDGLCVFFFNKSILNCEFRTAQMGSR
jgi:hypothetical protein